MNTGKDYINLHGSENAQNTIQARQMGGQAAMAPEGAMPPEGGAPQGPPQGAPDPQQMLAAFDQAMAEQNEQAARDIAFELVLMLSQQMAGVAAAMNGGVAPSFDEKGNLIR